MKLVVGNYKEFKKEEICDVYIEELFKEEKKGNKSKSLPDLLRDKKIYFDKVIIDSCIRFLIEKGYIELDLQRDAQVVYMPSGIRALNSVEDTIRVSCGVTSYFKLTTPGLSFKASGLKLEKGTSTNQTNYNPFILDLLMSIVSSGLKIYNIGFLIKIDFYIAVESILNKLLSLAGNLII